MTEKKLPGKQFWRKIYGSAERLGCRSLCVCLRLYFVLENPSLPRWVRVQVIGALIYFVSPLDLIPDLLPLGYSDDIKILLSAVALAGVYMGKEEGEKAQTVVTRFFKQCNCLRKEE